MRVITHIVAAAALVLTCGEASPQGSTGITWPCGTSNPTLATTKMVTDCAGVFAPGARLTLQSGTPVPTADQSAKSTVFYTCYSSPLVPVPNGTLFTPYAIPSCQISADLAAANILTGNLYDVFVIVVSNVATLCVGSSAWTSGSRSGLTVTHGSTTIRMTLGYWSNAIQLDHCYGGAGGTSDFGPVAIDHALYVGTLLATANGQTTMAPRPVATRGGNNTVCGLYNAYNQVSIQCKSQDSGDPGPPCPIVVPFTRDCATWVGTQNPANPASPNTPCDLAFNGGLSNRINFVDGLGLNFWRAHYITSVVPNDPSMNFAATVSIGLNSSTDPSGGGGAGQAEEQVGTPAPSTQFGMSIHASYTIYPPIGKNFVQCFENYDNVVFFGLDFMMLWLDVSM